MSGNGTTITWDDPLVVCGPATVTFPDTTANHLGQIPLFTGYNSSTTINLTYKIVEDALLDSKKCESCSKMGEFDKNDYMCKNCRKSC